MRSRASRSFWNSFRSLPPDVQAKAREAFRKFESSPSNSGLRFERIQRRQGMYSVRITKDYRVVGRRTASDAIEWIWIGPHNAYDKFLREL